VWFKWIPASSYSETKKDKKDFFFFYLKAMALNSYTTPKKRKPRKGKKMI